MKENIFGRLKGIQNILFGYGAFITGLILLAFLVVVALFLKLIKAHMKVEIIKEKVMWTPLFRG